MVKMYFQPTSQTDAGAFASLGLSGKPDSYAKNKSDEDEQAVSNELVNWAKTQGRVFVINANATFLFACATLVMLGFFSTLGPDTTASGHAHDRKLRYVAALAFVACMISAKQLRSIAKYRAFNFGHSPSAAVFAKKDVTAFANYNGKIAIGIELACNAIRHVDQLVSFIFLVHLFYFLAGTETATGTTIKTGHIFDTQSTPIFLAVLSVSLSAIVKIGTDGFWDYKDGKGGCRVSAFLSFVLWAVSVVLLILVVVDIDEAVLSAKGDNDVDLYRSFYLGWIGYPLVAAVGMMYRVVMRCSTDEKSYAGEIPEALAFFQDVLYGLLDAWCKGVLALWIAFTLFGVQLLNAPLANPLDNHI